MAISRSRVPFSATWETDGSCSTLSRRSSAARRNASSERAGEATASVMTSWETFRSSTSGCSARTGGKFSMLSIALWMSLKTASESAKVDISTVTLPIPWLAVPTTRSTPGSPTTLSSIRRLTSSSTSWGEAPGYSTVTAARRASISG